MSSNAQNNEAYFDNRIKNLQERLSITYDLSFLLLNAYQWEEDKIVEHMTKSAEETLERFHLHLGTDSFPTLKSSITAKLCEKDDCPICLEKTELLQLYCSHKICKQCFIDNVSYQLQKSQYFPTCPFSNEHKSTTLILPSDITTYITDPVLLEKYHKNFTFTCSLNCKGIKICKCCENIILDKNEFNCHTCQCQKCHFTYCAKCFSGCHAPLYDCTKVNQFINQGHFDILLLKKEQEEWIKRELRLHSYRSEHRDEYNAYFDQQIEKCKKILSDETKAKSDEISQLSADIESFKTKKESISDPEEVQSIERLIKRGEEIKEELVRQERLNSQSRNNFIQYIDDLKEHYFNAFIYEKEDMHDFFVCQFKSFIDDLFIKLDCNPDKKIGTETIINCPECGTPISPTGGCLIIKCVVCQKDFCASCGMPWDPSNKKYYECPITHVNLLKPEQKEEEDFALPKNCKCCPKCHSPIMRSAGSNVMTCTRCNHCFCWECLGPWDQTHENHFGCPSIKKYDKEEIEKLNDNENPDDKSFHPMPISPEKVIEFSKWCKLASQHHKIMVEIVNSKTLYTQKIQQMLNDTDLAIKYNNDIKFGESIIAWGYAELFYINDNETAKLAASLDSLKALLDILVGSIKNPWMKNPSAYFNYNIQLLYQKINGILNFVESVHK